MGMIGSVTSKGQTTIPKEVRDQLGLDQGTRIEWTVEDGKATVRPRKLRAIDLAGLLHRPGMKPVPIEAMDEAIGRYVAKDDRRIEGEWTAGFHEDEER